MHLPSVEIPHQYHGTQHTCACVAKWNINAIITDTYIYSNLPNKIFKSEIHDNLHFHKTLAPKDGEIETILLKLLEENRHFLQ